MATGSPLPITDGTQSKTLTANKEPNTNLIDQLVALGVTTDQLSADKVKVEVKLPGAWLGIITALGYILPFISLAAIFWFIFRQAQGSNNAAMSFGKSRARMFTGDIRLSHSKT